VQQWGKQDLLYQSNLSSSSVSHNTKLMRKVFQFGSGSDSVNSYLQKYLIWN
jgi:hypothetical protein